MAPRRSRSQIAAQRRIRIVWTILTLLLVSAMVLSLVASFTGSAVITVTPTPLLP